MVVSPELADALSAIIAQLRQRDGKITLTSRYDGHERPWQPPAPAVPATRRHRDPADLHRHRAHMLNTALVRTGA